VAGFLAAGPYRQAVRIFEDNTRKSERLNRKLASPMAAGGPIDPELARAFCGEAFVLTRLLFDFD
jgi:hypothetical protein